MSKKFLVGFLLICLLTSFAAYAETETIQETITLQNVELSPTPTPRPTPRVSIKWDKMRAYYGETLTIVSSISNADGAKSIEYQWFVDKGDGAGFVEIPGATNTTYSVVVTEELQKYSWRVRVTVEW